MADKNIEILISAKDQASDVLRGIQKNTTGLIESMRPAAIAMAAVGAATAVMGKSFVDAASMMEQQSVAFQTLVGDATLGKKTLEDLINFAAKTPFEIPQILEQSKRLLAMGVTAEELIPTFGALGDVAAGVGMEKLPQLVLAFGQIQATGRLMGTELRQLTEAGFNLADAMGISNQELRQLVENGDVSFDDVKQAFMDVTAEGGRFHNMMQDQSKTTAGQMSNLSDNVFKLKAAMGSALLPAVNSIIQALLPLVAQFAAFAEQHPRIVVGLVAIGLALGAIGAAILVITPIVTAFAALMPMLAAAGTALGAVFAFIVSPIGLVIAAIAALIAVGYLLYQNWSTIVAFGQTVWTQLVSVIQTAMLSIQQFFITIWTQIQTWLIEFWNNLTNNIFFQILMGLFMVIYNVLMLIWGVFQLIWTAISTVVEIAMLIIQAIVSAVLGAVLGYVLTHLNTIRANFMAVWNAISSFLTAILNTIRATFTTVWNAIYTFISNIFEKIRSYIMEKMNQAAEHISAGVEQMKGFFNSLMGAINSVIDRFNAMAEAASRALNAAKNAVAGAGDWAKGKLGFQHGGVVPGSFNQPVPTVLHGGERVVPRTGVDVNPPQGGGAGGGVTIIIEGDVNSTDTLDKMVEMVKQAIGRDNELAQLGVSI